ncbi:MAG: RecQ family ATP-dependent DNA helicase [Paludibacteraceae bacterium]|nr:RecQ family ATP-dependent DNA helicase [Paludibacteraceae bacterium]
MTPKEALQTYYGYKDFRPLQAEIIDSVLAGRDTLALMPTGGGKSICFQIPAIVRSGLCLVISPLIALMKDQVENLRQRGIQAAAIYSGMRLDKQRIALDNCQFGPYRCLYVSPERLQNEDFCRRLTQLPITLIAVDEAHCISEWGYDFRPSYLKIAEIRDTIRSSCIVHCQPSTDAVPILALTATATPDVVEDIQHRLAFRQPNVLKKSFARTNLSYVVRYCRDMSDKIAQLQHILSSVQGSAIVYVRNRKRAEELAELLHTSFYHAGLSAEERARRQEAWKNCHPSPLSPLNSKLSPINSQLSPINSQLSTINSQLSTIVCTNAFGMGIDKPDVRLVIHFDLPDTLEQYFQEAGRAGRDEQPAYAVLLYAPEDKTKARKRVHDNYPPKEFIESVYHKTCDFLCVGAGSGLGHSFALHLDELIRVMHLPLLQTYSALHILSQAGYIDFEDEQETQPRVRLEVSAAELQRYTLSVDQYNLLQLLMRQYPGIFTDLQYLHEEITESLHTQLSDLAARHIITYLPRTKAARFTFVKERQTDIWLSPEVYEKRAQHYTDKLQSMIEYAENTRFCRSQLLLSYFGENDAPCCGSCDICRAQR